MDYRVPDIEESVQLASYFLNAFNLSNGKNPWHHYRELSDMASSTYFEIEG